MQIEILPLVESNINSADRILRSAFQREDGWIDELNFYRKIQPKGGFIATLSGQPAGMVTATIYSNFAYIGWMGVHQDFQGHGVGTALMKHVIGWLDQEKVPTILLDATPAGQPLYEKLGFMALKQVYVLRGSAGHIAVDRNLPGVRPFLLQDVQSLSQMDSRAFGADRSSLLQALLDANPGRAFLLINENGQVTGYLIAQQKRIGPGVIQTPEGAEQLLEAALSLSFQGTISMVVPEVNLKAIQLLKRHGFEVVQVNRHMRFGPEPPSGQRENIFAQTSLSLG